MLSIELIRSDPEKVKAGIRAKNEVRADVDAILDLDTQRRTLVSEVEKLKQQRNNTSRKVAELKRAGRDPSAVIESTKDLSRRIKELDAQVAAVTGQRDRLLDWVPNMPAPGVPDGKGPEDNKVVSEVGKKPEFDFEPKPHWQLCPALGILDFERGAKIASSAFPLYIGHGAALERALVNFFLDLHAAEHGYTQVFPPFLVNRAAMYATGQLPKLEGDMYRVPEEDLFLIPTAEVPVTNIHAGEILAGKSLPLRYTAYSACFRREAGAYGKDTRGLLRVHQFNKVELVKFVRPEGSYEELESLRADAEDVLQRLGLHYRVVELCTGDLSFASSKCYDLEAWAPGAGKYLEVSSCSNFEDFQARRANIRFRDEEGEVRFVHTLNGSGVATARTLAAIVETYQQEDGSIVVPEVLRPYVGGMETIGPPHGKQRV